VPAFVAEASPHRSGPVVRLSVHPEDTAEIPVRINGRHTLSLIVDFTCTWDHRKTFLKVLVAKIHVTPTETGTPLFRYEFVHDSQPTVPGAHLHIHAHRDEFLFRLFMGEKGKAAARAKTITGESTRATPQLSDVHFPVGGPRMRPAIEDILQMLKKEFEIDTEPGYRRVLDEGRARWRRRQIGAAVRDAPEEAVGVLRELGYWIVEPNDGAPAERTDRLTCM
jgi:hypothetical protein